MVKSGQDILPVDYSSALHPLLPVEAIGCEALRQRGGAAHFARPQRVSFDCLILIHSGDGIHSVDFVDIPAEPGRLIRIRAGQVQSWDFTSTFAGTLVVSAPSASNLEPWFPGDPSFTDLSEEGEAIAEALVTALTQNQQRFDASPNTIRLMVALFDALAALFDQSADGAKQSCASPTYLEFRRALEHDLTNHHDVAYYARLMGYSERTLTRACLAATGRTAKQVLTSRLALEAKRLLAHTDYSVAEVSNQLGFSEPTNFTKFFARNAGTTPKDFRKGPS